MNAAFKKNYGIIPIMIDISEELGVTVVAKWAAMTRLDAATVRELGLDITIINTGQDVGPTPPAGTEGPTMTATNIVDVRRRAQARSMTATCTRAEVEETPDQLTGMAKGDLRNMLSAAAAKKEGDRRLAHRCRRMVNWLTRLDMTTNILPKAGIIVGSAPKLRMRAE